MSNFPSSGYRFVEADDGLYRRIYSDTFRRSYNPYNPTAAYDSALPRLMTAADCAAYGREAARKLGYGPGMAMDLTLPEQDEEGENARQNEQDEGDAEVEAQISQMAKWAKENLSEKDVKMLANRLLDDKDSAAQDEPAFFPGKPKTGGSKAMDGGTSAFYGAVDTARPRRRAHEMNASERLSLDTLVPGLARIRVI
jgi:hypothetical protein